MGLTGARWARVKPLQVCGVSYAPGRSLLGWGTSMKPLEIAVRLGGKVYSGAYTVGTR
jgi:hypothetical protein